MKTAKCTIGVFDFDDKNELFNYKLFSRNPEKAVEEFLASKIAESEEARMLLRKRMREYALDLRFAQSNEELNNFLSAFALLMSKRKMKGLIAIDKVIVQAFNAMEDMAITINVFSERLKEWYTLHYPELKISQRELAGAVLKYGKRENFPAYKDSVGVELSDEDIRIVKEYANIISEMIDKLKNLEKYVKETVKTVAPNFSSIIEPLLAARFIALAGSLERLARMPASTIQLLGAEKALFRHLKKQGKSPKYGILYMDARIQNAPQDKKGKVARVIAAKLMLAARIDFYSGRVDEKLKQQLEQELNNI